MKVSYLSMLPRPNIRHDVTRNRKGRLASRARSSRHLPRNRSPETMVVQSKRRRLVAYFPRRANGVPSDAMFGHGHVRRRSTSPWTGTATCLSRSTRIDTKTNTNSGHSTSNRIATSTRWRSSIAASSRDTFRFGRNRE